MSANEPALGLFEWLNPVFGLVDSVVGFLPDNGRIFVLGLIGGLVSMYIFKLVSPQDKLKALAEETKALSARISSGEAGAGALFKTHMKASMKRLALAIPGTLVSALPLLFIMGYLHAEYTLDPVRDKELMAVLIDDPDQIQVEGGQKLAAGWVVVWPDEGETVTINNEAGDPVFVIRHDTKPGLVSQSGILTFIFGAQAGSLADDAGVEDFYLETSNQALLLEALRFPFQWLIAFMLGAMISSLTLKSVLRIY